MGNADSKDRPIGSGFILFSDDHSKLLLVQDAHTKKWGFPKGHVEISDSSDIHTAIRECNEETGLKESDYEIMPGAIIYNSYNFRYARLKGSYISKTLVKGANSEILDLRWISLEDVLWNRKRDTNMYLRSWIAEMKDPKSQAKHLFLKHFDTLNRKRVRKTRKQQRK